MSGYATQTPRVDLPRQLEGLEREFLDKLNKLSSIHPEKILDYLNLRLDWLKSTNRRLGGSIELIALNNADQQGRIDEIEMLVKIFSDPEGESNRIKTEGL